MKKSVKIVVGGSCKGFRGIGKWFARLIFRNKPTDISGEVKATTTHRIHLTALCTALSKLKEPCDVSVETSSIYIDNASSKGWVKRWSENNWMRNKYAPAKNANLWAKYLDLAAPHDISITYTGKSEKVKKAA